MRPLSTSDVRELKYASLKTEELDHSIAALRIGGVERNLHSLEGVIRQLYEISTALEKVRTNWGG